MSSTECGVPLEADGVVAGGDGDCGVGGGGGGGRGDGGAPADEVGEDAAGGDDEAAGVCGVGDDEGAGVDDGVLGAVEPAAGAGPPPVVDASSGRSIASAGDQRQRVGGLAAIGRVERSIRRAPIRFDEHQAAGDAGRRAANGPPHDARAFVVVGASKVRRAVGDHPSKVAGVRAARGRAELETDRRSARARGVVGARRRSEKQRE